VIIPTAIIAFLHWSLLIPVICGSIFYLLCLATALHFRRSGAKPASAQLREWPAVTVLKPVCGLEKGLEENLRSTCMQDYPEFEVILSAQRADDPAIPLLWRIQQEFGTGRVRVAVDNCRAGTNGKINNLLGGIRHARHEVLVISDSDIRLRPDYLRTIVAGLAEPGVGCVSTLYKAVLADAWYEKMELLTLNADLIPSVIFAYLTGAAKPCLGASIALRRSTLEAIGGLEALGDYLVEDHELGRRIVSSGRKLSVLPYVVDTILNLKNPREWWNHQVYWDQNNRAARPYAYFSAIVVRAVPFAVLYALTRFLDSTGLLVLAGTLALRLTVSALTLGVGLRDREGLRSLYLLPIRDLIALWSFILAYTKRTTVWRGTSFTLTRDGRLIDLEPQR
jgi:ceramide glucosyltransferase